LRTVLISGWATGNEVWEEVSRGIPDPEHLCWNTVLLGEFTLPDPCILAGWSLGGQLAMDLSERPEVRGLVLVSSMTCLVMGEERPGIEPERCSMITRMLSRSRIGYLTSFFRECGASPAMVRRLLDSSERFSMDELVAGLAVMFNHVAAPSPFIPARVIHGTEDRIVPYETAGYLISSAFRSAGLVTVENGGHGLPFSEAETVIRVVNELACSLDA
jgi:pimeloyl-ACP methyl ester carboxylesterase